MSKHNYSQYYNKNRDGKTGAVAANAVKDDGKKNNENKPAEVKMESVANEPEVLMGPIETTPVVETVETVTPSKTVEGVVFNCAKLNVRSKPSITGEIVCVLNVSSEIEIDVEKSIPDWFYICTATGVEGYCMRQFVEANL